MVSGSVHQYKRKVNQNNKNHVNQLDGTNELQQILSKLGQLMLNKISIINSVNYKIFDNFVLSGEVVQFELDTGSPITTIGRSF